MACFKNTDSHSDKERPFDLLDAMERPGRNIVMKRTASGHWSLEKLPPDVHLLYSVRHPLDTLTSRMPGSKTFYVSEFRWRAEYAALKILHRTQPSRKVTYIRYNDLVTTPDIVQKQIADALGLQIERPFSESEKIFSSSVAKYERDPALWASLCLLPLEFRQVIKEFCDEFGFELPEGYLSAVSPLQTEIRKLLSQQAKGRGKR
jgi:hypothetical protein